MELLIWVPLIRHLSDNAKALASFDKTVSMKLQLKTTSTLTVFQDHFLGATEIPEGNSHNGRNRKMSRQNITTV